MKKTLVSLVLLTLLLAIVKPASAHRWRSGLVPFAAGAATGVVIAGAYYHRPPPVYYGPSAYFYPYTYYPPPVRTAAFCPENGLYYPQTQACPSGWQLVPY
jgi:hypothetical protein